MTVEIQYLLTRLYSDRYIQRVSSFLRRSVEYHIEARTIRHGYAGIIENTTIYLRG